MEKMRMESVDLTAQNIEKIGALFPACVTETRGKDGKLRKAINFDMLKQILSSDVAEGSEAYEFTWVGKRAAMVEANRPIRKTLRPCKEESVDWDATENLYIEGDNLDVLKLLQESYLGKVKMIYIDPPYNTGNDFIYRDDFAMGSEEWKAESGEVDEEGDRLFKNTDTNGRFHSDWCSMIYSRLLLARNLLTEDGVIFISIDEHESHTLRVICDEVFGVQNFISQIVWEKRYTRSNNAKRFTTLTEPVLCYAKDVVTVSDIKEKRNKKADSIYSNPDGDPRGVWTSVSYVNPATKDQRPNLSYPLINPYTGATVEHPTNAWKYEKATYERHVKEKRLYWGKSGENTYPRLKKFLSEMEGGMVPVDLWRQEDTGTTDQASKELETLLGRKIFDFPKPKELIKRIISLIINGDSGKDSIVLDFFSGSATTAHAVMQLNAEDGGKRKFIMVQLPELCDEKSEAYKAGYTNICEIGKERIRRAGKKVLKEMEEKREALRLEQEKQAKDGKDAGSASLFASVDAPNISAGDDEPFKLDVGFRVLKLDDTNMKDVYYAPDDFHQETLDGLESNIKEDRTDLDLLFSCLLEWGLPLSGSYHAETIDGCTVHSYDEIMACFDENIPETVIRTIARRQPAHVVFRDSGFADSPSKINVTQIFKELAPDTSVKVL